MSVTPQRIVLHVDMDAFFASVEQLDHPEWRGKPVIVGAGPHERGVVSTCSYEARRFGVHSAMPSRTAFAKCPNGIFVTPRMTRYQEVSAAAFKVFANYSPFVEPVSVDEAFLDISGSAHLFGGPRMLAEQLRREVRRVCGVTCSVGIGPNRLLAKIASEHDKPDGLFVMPFEEEAIQRFLGPQPVNILWGVGKTTSAELLRLGFRTCGDLQRADIRFLQRVLGETAATSIRAHAMGLDDTPIAYGESTDKSVSREYTFPMDETSREAVRKVLLELVREVGRRFRTEKRWARTARVKLRNTAFETRSRQARFELAARDDQTFREQALSLFGELWDATPVRLIGFGVTDITTSPVDPEPTLFGIDPRVTRREKRERLSAALDALGDYRVLVYEGEK